MVDDIRQRLKQTTDYGKAIINPARYSSPPTKTDNSSHNFRKILFISAPVLVLVAATLAGWKLWPKQSSPVPANIQKAVNFKIYYPDLKKIASKLYARCIFFQYPG
jgi:hypothetical protein